MTNLMSLEPLVRDRSLIMGGRGGGHERFYIKGQKGLGHAQGGGGGGHNKLRGLFNVGA